MKMRTEHAERQIFRRFVRILCVCMLSMVLTLPEGCFSTGEETPPAESVKPVERNKPGQDTFQNLSPIEVPPWGVEHLKKRGLSPETVSGMLKPDNWSVSWSSFTPGCRLAEQNGHWRISGASGLVLNQVSVSLTRTRRFHISLTVEAADGERENPEISLGVIQYGTLQSGKKILVRQEIEAGETATMEAPLFFERGTPRFRIMLEITGDVILKEMVLTELPDDLAQDGITLVEGTVEECSAIPTPRKSDYPDCRFTMHFAGDHILRGASCPREIQLLADGFLKYRLLPTSKLKKGDRIRCYIMPFEKLPEERQTTQQADDLELFTLENYYLLECETIKWFYESGSDILFSDDNREYIALFERKINPPLPEELERQQAQEIESDLKKIDALLDGWTEEKKEQTEAAFQKAWDAEKAKDKPGFNRVGEYVWRNADNSFWCLPETYTLIEKYDPITPWNLECLTALRDFLRANGCQLIVSLLPDSYAMAARVINPEFRHVPDFQAALTVRELLEHGIEAVYVPDELLKAYNRYPFAYFFPSNPHPADTAQDVIADMLTAKLMRFGFPETLVRSRFSIGSSPHVYDARPDRARYAFPQNCDIGDHQPGTGWQCRQVLYENRKLLPDPESPILFFGNSYMQTPMDWPDSLPTLLSEKMAVPSDFYRIAGSGPMTSFIQSLIRDPEKFLKGKKVIICTMGVWNLHNGVRFCSIREMDRQALLLGGKTRKKIFPVSGGNTEEMAKFARNLDGAEFFTIPADGKYLIAEISLPEEEMGTSARCLSIPVCAKAPCPAKLEINGIPQTIPECYGVYQWNKIVTEIPEGTEKVKIELTGEPGTVLAVSNIQLYR